MTKFDLKLRLYKLVLNDRRTPKAVKWLLGLMVGYFLLPFDFITDLIPGLGFVDDLLIIFSIIWFIFKIIPQRVFQDSREKAK